MKISTTLKRRLSTSANTIIIIPIAVAVAEAEARAIITIIITTIVERANGLATETKRHFQLNE